MATNTYVALTPSITLASNTTTVTLSSIPSGYTDLRLVFVPASSDGTNGIRMRINGDTGSNYSITYLSGNGTSAISNKDSNASQISLSYFGGITTSLGGTQVAIDFQNYSNTTTYKTALVRYNMASSSAEANVALWRSTSAITSLSFNINSFGSSTGDFIAGSTFSLYGIANADNFALATGGTLYEDSTYWYHVFASSGTFTPKQSLTCDALVVGGGGGGGWNNGGGGGGAELAFNTGSSYSSGTPLTVTVGAGGTFATSTSSSGANGSNSSITGITTALGGGGGGTGDATNTALRSGQTGGSGGGSSLNGSSGGGASGSNTNVGGAGYAAANNYQGGGGGGATAAGTAGVSANAGDGGEGKLLSTFFTSADLGISYLGSGGGGGGYLSSGAMTRGFGGTNGGNGAMENSTSGNANPTAGTANTGSGGGGGAYTGVNSRNGAAGGSGLVVIRYAKV
jgi:mucin-19